jgi:hypothetical protein
MIHGNISKINGLWKLEIVLGIVNRFTTITISQINQQSTKGNVDT